MNTSWHSYPKVWSLGHAAISELFLDQVHAEEKIDGSQFSFGRFGDELKIRSKGLEMDPNDPESMFRDAANTARDLAPILTDGWTYRCEYLQKPRHNILQYQRVPHKNLIVFDINSGEESYLDYESKKNEAARLHLECVPILFAGEVKSVEELKSLLEHESCLGGQKIEGIVFKNYRRFGPDKKALLGKFVSERFKEKHKLEWREMNPLQNDIIRQLQLKYSTEMRFEKAVQHLMERGELTQSPKDISALMKEVKKDSLEELKLEVMDDLFKWAWPQIERALPRGLPEWYKERLAKIQFGESK